MLEEGGEWGRSCDGEGGSGEVGIVVGEVGGY